MSMRVRTNTPATLNALSDRQTPAQAKVRAAKKQARSTVAAILQGQMNLLGQYVVGHIQMGLISRVRWALFGAKFNKTAGSIIMVLLVILILLGAGRVATGIPLFIYNP